MEIYAEYLFLENFAAGLFILLITARICGRRIKKLRLILGSFLCGVYSFIILIHVGAAAAIAGKTLFSVFIVVYVFALFPGHSKHIRTQVKAGVKILLTFYLISFLMGGVTVAGMYLLKIPGISGNGAFYIHTTYFHIAFGIGITWLMGCAFAKYVKERGLTEKVFRDVSVEINEKTWTLKAMIDTGNFLKDPETGRPVAIICKSASDEILKSGKTEYSRFTLIPYKSVGAEGGVLLGFRADQVIVDEKTIKDMVLAIYEDEFSLPAAGESYRMLLNRELLEGGLAVHV